MGSEAPARMISHLCHPVQLHVLPISDAQCDGHTRVGGSDDDASAEVAVRRQYEVGDGAGGRRAGLECQEVQRACRCPWIQ